MFGGILVFLGVSPILLTCVVILIHQRKTRISRSFSPFTEEFFRPPGYSLGLKIHKDLEQAILTIAIMVVVPLVSTFGAKWSNPIIPYTFLVVVSVASVICIRRLISLLKRIASTALGREGEIYTGQELNWLMRDKAFVFHDLPYRYGNIDHVVVGQSRIFVVETKAVRKPGADDNGNGRSASVVFDGERLKFPHFTSDQPCKQALRHAEFLQKTLERKVGACFPVTAVVALPGWFVKHENKVRGSRLMVINPHRGKALRAWIGELQDKSLRDRLAAHLASVACSIEPRSRIDDPTATEKFDFWMNPRYKSRLLGE